MAIPILYQSDFTRPVCYYNGQKRTVETSGCNVTCLSMVVAYLTGNIEQNPETMLYWAVSKNMYFGDGLSHDAMTKVAKHYGVESKWIGRNKDLVLEALKSGLPIIAHMGPGVFTDGGHYIVLRGITPEGRILVSDPVSRRRTAKSYALRLIVGQAVEGGAFMLLTTPEPTAAPDAE